MIKYNTLEMDSFEVKLYVFAYLRDVFAVEREVKVVLKRSKWDSVEELKKEILNTLWLNRVSKTESEVESVSPSTIMLAMNEKLIEHCGEINVSKDDILALIPPVSGG